MPPDDASKALASSGDSNGVPGRSISLPIAGLQPGDIQDTFDQARGTGERRHAASDIMAPRGTPVIAVDTGVIKKLFNSKQGGLTVYQFDSSERFCYYYAHLDRYAEGLREGMSVRRGERIGYVGSTGNADPSAPHLHFAIFELGPEKNWWEGKPLNPYPILMQAFK
jgi:murein DD-endopeptidase MepM/ murein hydrolase activator NlpD